MGCTSPLKGYRAAVPDPITGRRALSFRPSESYTDLAMEVPCGQCMACRIAKSREWAMRSMHEAQLHEHNQFLTLTYSDEKLPRRGTLEKHVFPAFMKRLRKSLGEKRVTYLYVGEYGERTKRPHYHALVFGLPVADLVLFSESDRGKLWTSETLTRLWGLGHVVIGAVTYETAAYVARYTLKKVNGKQAEEHYRRVDAETGEVYQLEPEFIGMSVRPAIGKRWFERYSTDLYPSGFAVHKGRKSPIPKYYDRLYSRTNPEHMEEMKKQRLKDANTIERKKEQTPHRRAVRAECLALNIKNKERKL